jgi:hypothetical protein
MTRKNLSRVLVLVTLYFAALLAVAVYARLHGAGAPGTETVPTLLGSLYSTFKDFSALLIAIPAAWLASCFSRRSAFLAKLDELWLQMVEAKSRCVRFTFEPTNDTYVEAWLSLSGAIDSMRSVYRNVKETKSEIGWFPYQPLHDMRGILQAGRAGLIGGEPARKAAAQKAMRGELIAAWNGLRSKYLLEFGAPAPSEPIIGFNYVDPRRATPDTARLARQGREPHGGGGETG